MVDQAIVPIYTTEHPNDVILISKECTQELRTPALILGKGRLEFGWQPTKGPRFIFEPLSNEPFAGNMRKQAILNILSETTTSFNVYVTHVDNLLAPTELEGTIISHRDLQPCTCDEVIFHIPNMSRCIGDIITYPSGSEARRRTVLDGNGWEILIDVVENLDKLKEELRRHGGFAITHVGVLRKKEKEQFSFIDARDQLNALGFFLSFAEGRWCCPILRVGMKNSNRVCEDFTSYRVQPTRGNWYWKPTEATYLRDAYLMYSAKWRKPNLQDVLAKAISLYIRANNTAEAELSVLDAFTGLDCLAGKYGWESLPGYDRINRVLGLSRMHDLILSTLIYDHYDSFYRKNGLKKDTNCANILNDFRNGVVHGDRKDRPSLNKKLMPLEVKLEAMNLALWCLELSILKLVGYNGKYKNRLQQGSETTPPWI